jgi:hypothetical protein
MLLVLKLANHRPQWLQGSGRGFDIELDLFLRNPL